MALNYAPSRGEVLICRFPEDHRAPEMVKTRPVLVLNSQAQIKQSGGLVTIVPISLTKPEPVKPWHLQLPLVCVPEPMRRLVGDRWAKCDMLYTFHMDRLELAKGPKARARRTYHKGKADLQTLEAIRDCVSSYLEIGRSSG